MSGQQNGYPAMKGQYRTAIGQDSHRFVSDEVRSADPARPLMLGGITLDGERSLDGNSDADVILHALTNAISGLTGVNILGPVADRMCLVEKITDSAAYLNAALETLGERKLIHVSLSVECKKPHLTPHIPAIKSRIAALTGLSADDIGLTATSGEGLTAFGRGEGIAVLCLVTVYCP